eukprot:TRINITY_DN61774_c0_g1_i1.p1 TRINITY_DN61774_c0_g1~~TRINITY_DN61774_c0_g1_i1.p1  ORF type:complete len:537 (+),score=113.87 TRINITY_DN61774_c0_g1_i1:189-1613(+)
MPEGHVQLENSAHSDEDTCHQAQVAFPSSGKTLDMAGLQTVSSSQARCTSADVAEQLGLPSCSANLQAPLASRGEFEDGNTPFLEANLQLALDDARHSSGNDHLQPTVSPRMAGSSAPAPSTLGKTGEQKKMEDEFNERRQWLKTQADLRVADLKADASLLNIPAEGALAVQQQKAEAWKVLQKAMGVDEKGLKRDSWESWLMGIVNLSYLMVIVGCELDLYGFMMAWQAYWDMGRMELQILLVICPVGYLLATAMYMAYNRKVLQRMEEESKRLKQLASQQGPRAVSRLTAREPIKVEYYHFLPIFRYYLVIKDKEAADIEGLFRVNSLSSFSLGIAQIAGILFQSFVQQTELSIFVKINVGSQMLNWFITLAYFTTPVAARMKSAIKVDSLIYNSNQEMRRLYENYMQTAADYASDNTDENQQRLLQIEATVDREICEFCKTTLDLSQFDMKTKVDALRMIRRKLYNSYAKI